MCKVMRTNLSAALICVLHQLDDDLHVIVLHVHLGGGVGSGRRVPDARGDGTCMAAVASAPPRRSADADLRAMRLLE